MIYATQEKKLDISQKKALHKSCFTICRKTRDLVI